MTRPTPPRSRRKASPSRAYRCLEASGRRTAQNAVIGFIVLLTLFFLLSPRAPVQDLRLFHHTPSHRPPAQTNSTSGEVRWYSDWKWLKPFSASITLDEDRTVLPPLHTRPPIYTYYDADEKKDANTRAAENHLLLIWRRAWWAQGFRPVVLGKSEATQHPQYNTALKEAKHPQMKTELLRWLAWGQMGTGILANWLVHPMGAKDENLLSKLHKGDHSLSRYEGLSGGLFSGEKNAINAAILEALASPNLGDAKSIQDVLSSDTLSVSPKPSEIAFYDSQTNSEHFKAVTVALAEDKAEGLQSLAHLINSHLHLTFLNTFPDGFAVLTPFSSTASILSQRARALAEALRTCPESPIPSSCPPNRPNCTPCSSTTPLPVKSPESFSNSSSVYTIGSVPHPLTLASLKRKSKEITTRYIRRDTPRDPWLNLVTEKTLGKDLGGLGRIVPFKGMVASDWALARNLWMTDDQPLLHKSVEYHFGFAIPSFNSTTVFLDDLNHKDSQNSGAGMSTKEKNDKLRSLKVQTDLLVHAQRILENEKKRQSKDATSAGAGIGGAEKKGRRGSAKTGVKEMVEAWNLADTEAWRFVRAFVARERVERMKWEQEERKFAGGDLDDADGGVWRWFDRS